MSDLFLYVKSETEISAVGIEVPDDCIDHEILGVNNDILEDQELMNSRFQEIKTDTSKIKNQVICSEFASNLNDYTYCNNLRSKIIEEAENKENLDNGYPLSINPQAMFNTHQINNYCNEMISPSDIDGKDYNIYDYSPYPSGSSQHVLFKKSLNTNMSNNNNFLYENDKPLNSVSFYDPLDYLNTRNVGIFEKDELFSDDNDDKGFSQNSREIMINIPESYKYTSDNETFINKRLSTNNHCIDHGKEIDAEYGYYDILIKEQNSSNVKSEKITAKINNENAFDNNLDKLESKAKTEKRKIQNAKKEKTNKAKTQKNKAETAKKKNHTNKTKKPKKAKIDQINKNEESILKTIDHGNQQMKIATSKVEIKEANEKELHKNEEVTIDATIININTEIEKLPKKRGRKKKVKRNTIKSQDEASRTVESSTESQSKLIKKKTEKDEDFHVKFNNIQDLTNSEYRRYSTRTRKQVNYYYPIMGDSAVDSFDDVKIDNSKDDGEGNLDEDEDYEDDDEDNDNGSKKRRRILKNRKKSGRSKNGCWTCRLRRKKCPEERPSCSQCNRLGSPCDGYSMNRPSFMYEKASQLRKLNEIKEHTGKTRKVRIAWMHQRQKEKREKERLRKETNFLKGQPAN